MESSILASTKKVLGIGDNTSFDEDILMHINSTFFTLNQLGVGPVDGYRIEDASADWDAFLPEGKLQDACKTYMFLKVRMLFDPPATSYLLDSMEKQLEQQEWRINVEREATEWIDPDPPVVDNEEEVII